MTIPTGAAAIRKTLKEKIKPAVDKAESESNKIWNLLVDLDKGAEKAIADGNIERMELHEAGYRACQKRAGVLLVAVETQLKGLDELAKTPAFVEELATFNQLTKTLDEIKQMHQAGLTSSRDTIAQMDKARQKVRGVAGAVDQQWAVAEAQVAAASKESAAALVAMKALRLKADKAVKDGNAKALAPIKAQAKAFKAPLGPAAAAKISQLLASTLLFINKSAIDADALKVYERDGKALTDKANGVGADVVEVLRLQLEIDKLAVPTGAFIAGIVKAMKIPPADATRLGKVAQDNPAKLLAEIDATITRLKLKLVAKDVLEALKRVGLI